MEAAARSASTDERGSRLRASTLKTRDLFSSCKLNTQPGRERFVWLNNFECEQFWASARTARLFSLTSPAENAIVNRMEEMCLWLAGEPDAVILRNAPAPDFLSYLAQIGIALPEILTVEPETVSPSISQAILDGERFCRQLNSLKNKDADLYLLAYGNTNLEEKIAAAAGIPLLGPQAAVAAVVNSKIFSRRLSRRLGLRTVPGDECESLEELERALLRIKPHVAAGGKAVLKEAMGVSGKGLLVIENPEKLNQVLDFLKRRHKPELEYAFVVEQWIEKQKDINYQIFVTPSGGVKFLAIKESFADGAVHAGHRCPPNLDEAQMDSYREAALAVGRELHRSGYTGIAGIDSVVDREGKIYPVLEINARFNMSTYQLSLERALEPGTAFIVKNYSLLLKSLLRFQDLAGRLGTSLFGLNGSMRGVGVMCFATVNCNMTPSVKKAKGRLYVFIAGKDFSEIDFLDKKTQGCLEACGAAVTAR